MMLKIGRKSCSYLVDTCQRAEISTYINTKMCVCLCVCLFVRVFLALWNLIGIPFGKKSVLGPEKVLKQ